MWRTPAPRSTAAVAAAIWSGTGEDLAGAGRVEHAGSDEAGVKGLVPAAAAGDHGDPPLLLGGGAVDDAPVDVDAERARMGRGHARQGVRNDAIGGIDELFHAPILR